MEALFSRRTVFLALITLEVRKFTVGDDISNPSVGKENLAPISTSCTGPSPCVEVTLG